MREPRDARGARARSSFRGCLLGGAVGDALGAAVEFDSLATIHARFGPAGLQDLSPAFGRVGAITDDTQMTLFTAEALLRARHLRTRQPDAPLGPVAWRAYLRWLETQEERPGRPPLPGEEGGLLSVAGLWAVRGPGNTCLSALRGGRAGTTAFPVNGGKGCGGVMRVAPAGFLREDPFRSGCELAALTHGHPTGWLASGFMAQLVHEVAGGSSIEEGAARALAILRGHEDHAETSAAVERAVAASRSSAPDASSVEALGQGWVAEEALAIGLFAALAARSFEHGVLLAVNHSGDSDSTGAIAGSLLGLALGEEAIPARWRDRLELREVIEQVADDLHAHLGEGELICTGEACAVWGRYPPC